MYGVKACPCGIGPRLIYIRTGVFTFFHLAFFRNQHILHVCIQIIFFLNLRAVRIFSTLFQNLHNFFRFILSLVNISQSQVRLRFFRFYFYGGKVAVFRFFVIHFFQIPVTIRYMCFIVLFSLLRQNPQKYHRSCSGGNYQNSRQYNPDLFPFLFYRSVIFITVALLLLTCLHILIILCVLFFRLLGNSPLLRKLFSCIFFQTCAAKTAESGLFFIIFSTIRAIHFPTSFLPFV